MKKLYLLFSIIVIAAGLLFLERSGERSGAQLESKKGKGNPFEEDEKEDGAREALKQEVLMTKDPKLGYVPTERLIEYKDFIKRHPELRSSGSGGRAVITDGGAGGSIVPLGNAGGGLTWTERGPNNIGGRCRAILVDKTDVSGNTVLVGSVSGGLWRTTNFTAASPTWTQNSTVLANLAITTLAQDPTNFNTIYAGTGEGYFNIDAIRGLGIYKSTDGGITWSLLAATTTGGANANDLNYIQGLAVYSNGDVYAGGRSASCCNAGGILKSTDGGNSWTRVVGNYTGCGSCSCALNFNGYDIAFSSGGDIYASVIDASTGVANGKIYKSPAGTTAGNSGTWTDVTPTPGGASWQRIQLACSPATNNRVYAFLQGSGNVIGGIRRTDDGGATWVNINNSTAWCSQGISSGTDFSNGQAWYDLTLAVNPGNDAIVYAAGVDMMTTTNSGTSWAQVTQWAASCASLPHVHADIHNITFIPGSSTSFIVGCDGGIFYTTDGGNSFVSKDGGLNVTQYYGAALHPASGSNYMLGAAQDNGSHIFNSAGINSVSSASGGDGVTCFIDQSAPTTQITSYTNATYIISRDGGNSFPLTFTSTDGRFLNAASYDNSLKHLYCGSKDKNLKRIDNIVTGTPAGTDIAVATNAQLAVSAVKVDPNAADMVWVAFSTSDDASVAQAPLLYLVTGASTGSPVVTNMGSATLLPGAGAYINSIDVEQGNANHLVVAVSNYGVASVWESTDHGATWTSLDNNGVNLPDLPVYWAMIVPATDNVKTGGSNGGILLATEMGIWSTSASAGTSTVWTENSATMGNVSTRMLQYRSSDNQVVAATHGRGLFTTSLTAIALPLDFTSFTGTPMGLYNHLDWIVADEYNNKGFGIERSYAGISGFTRIGFTPSVSTSFHASDSYSFTDSLVDLGQRTSLYRLQQVDLDGKVAYSTIVSIEREPSNTLVQYLSVSGNTLFIRINSGNTTSPLSFRILDMTGQLIAAREIPYQSQSIDISALARGIYVVQLLSKDGKKFTGQFRKL
jgi:Secretion system C-terminal sorting domain